MAPRRETSLSLDKYSQIQPLEEEQREVEHFYLT